MSTVTTKDGTKIYYKGWGSVQPVVFSHGWPLSADDWDTHLLFFLNRGYRVIAPHGMPTTEAGTIDADLLAFFKGTFESHAVVTRSFFVKKENYS